MLTSLTAHFKGDFDYYIEHGSFYKDKQHKTATDRVFINLPYTSGRI
jgi:hypothetical protein